MKANKLNRGQVARGDDGSFLVWEERDIEYPITELCVPHGIKYHNPDQLDLIEGDYTLLLPPTPIEDLEPYIRVGQWFHINHIRNKAIVVTDDAKVRELEEQVELLEEYKRLSLAASGKVERMERKVRTLREQLETVKGDADYLRQVRDELQSVIVKLREQIAGKRSVVDSEPEPEAVPSIGDIPEELASALRDILLDELGSDEAEELLGSIIHDSRLLAALEGAKKHGRTHQTTRNEQEVDRLKQLLTEAWLKLAVRSDTSAWDICDKIENELLPATLSDAIKKADKS